jgi:hypothetical protein
MPIINLKSVQIDDEMLKLILKHLGDKEVFHMQNLINDIITITYEHWLADSGLRIAEKNMKDAKEYTELFHNYFKK